MAHARKVFLLGIVLLIAPTVSSAAFIPTTDLVPLDTLGGEPLAVDGREFSNFAMDAMSSGGAPLPLPGDVYLQGGTDGDGCSTVLRFLTCGWVVGPGQAVQVNVSFDVSVVAGEGCLIDAVALDLTGFATPGSSMISAGEFVAGSPGGGALASLSASKSYGDADAYLSDSVSFAETNVIHVTKSFALVGDSRGGGIAHLGEFYQFYRNMPEPSVLVLSGLGAMLVCRRRR